MGLRVMCLVIAGCLLGCGAAQIDQHGIPRESIRRVIRARIEEVRSCYETQLAIVPELVGRVTLRLVIVEDGSVERADADSDFSPREGEGLEVERCVVEASRSWVFPAHSGVPVLLRYPLYLDFNGDEPPNPAPAP